MTRQALFKTSRIIIELWFWSTYDTLIYISWFSGLFTLFTVVTMIYLLTTLHLGSHSILGLRPPLSTGEHDTPHHLFVSCLGSTKLIWPTMGSTRAGPTRPIGHLYFVYICINLIWTFRFNNLWLATLFYEKYITFHVLLLVRKFELSLCICDGISLEHLEDSSHFWLSSVVL
jgi:hypothetical protein